MDGVRPRRPAQRLDHQRESLKLKTKSVTRLWKAGGNETACGTLFHNAVEAFDPAEGLSVLTVVVVWAGWIGYGATVNASNTCEIRMV